MKYILLFSLLFNILNADAFILNNKDKQRIKNSFDKKKIAKRIFNFYEFFKKAKSMMNKRN